MPAGPHRKVLGKLWGVPGVAPGVGPTKGFTARESGARKVRGLEARQGGRVTRGDRSGGGVRSPGQPLAGRGGSAPARSRHHSASPRIGRLAGVDIRVHWTFSFLVVLVAWAAASSGVGAVVGALVWVAAVFASVLVHELAHCVVARRRGAVVEDILLLPLGGLSQLSRMPEAPADEFAIAVVGPLTSLALGAGFAVLGAAAGAPLWPPTLFGGSWLARLTWLNVLLGGFNVLPALPMDGGRLLRAGLARRLGRRDATRVAATVARVLAFVMIVAGLTYDIWLGLFGAFVLLGAGAEEAAADGGEASGRSPHDHPEASASS